MVQINISVFAIQYLFFLFILIHSYSFIYYSFLPHSTNDEPRMASFSDASVLAGSFQ